MDDRHTVLTDADQAYAELRRAVDGLGEDEAREPFLGTWGVREILIHIAGWDREMTPALERIGRGERAYPPGVSYDDADAWNARFVEAGKDAKLAQVLADLEAGHRGVAAAAAGLGAEHFAEGAKARGVFEGTTAGHYREHTEQIVRWRKDGAR